MEDGSEVDGLETAVSSQSDDGVPIAYVEQEKKEPMPSRLHEEPKAAKSVGQKWPVIYKNKRKAPGWSTGRELAKYRQQEGLGPDIRVFCVHGAYSSVRKVLHAWGWHENRDVTSTAFDFKWTLKKDDIKHHYDSLESTQVLNHFLHATELCSKSCLTRNLRAVETHPAVAKLGLPLPDAFYPRSYILNVPGELRNLVEDVIATEAEAILARALRAPQPPPRLAAAMPEGEEEASRLQRIGTLRISVAIKVAQRMLVRRQQERSSGEPPAEEEALLLQSEEEWKALFSWKAFQMPKFLHRMLSPVEGDSERSQPNRSAEALVMEARRCHALLESGPQGSLNGDANLWIAKAPNLSRGRGIECFQGSSIVKMIEFAEVTYLSEWPERG